MESPENTIYDPNEFKAAEKVILRWDSTVSEDARERMIFDGDRNEVDRYLNAVDEIQRSLQSTSIEDPNKVNCAIQIAMARLEDEFRNILLSNTNPLDNDSVYDPFACSSTRTDSVSDFEDFSVEEEDEDVVAAAAAAADGVGEESLHLGGVGGESSNSRSGGVKSFRSTNSSYRSTDSIREIELMPYDVIDDLRSIAERMIVAGYFRECIHVYASVRKSVIDSNFKRIGVEKLSIGDIQRLDWETLETKIRRWIRAAKVCVRVVFASEKKLCEQIFEGLVSPDTEPDPDPEPEHVCFVETVKGPVVQLFNFAEAISISRRSPEKLFKILDLHDALFDLLTDMDAIFESKASEFIRVQAAEIVSRLAEAARGILSEFESAVVREPSKIPVPGGRIHPLTRYVMNYISLISDYKQTLTELIVSKPSTGSSYSGDLPPPDMEFADLDEKTPLELHLIWIIVILQFNLDEKSKHYRDISLAHLFMMNNIHYIVHKVKGSPELREMIEDRYLKKLSGKYIQAATSYQRATWVRVLNCLRDEGLHVSGNFSSGVSKSALRERFKTFNAMFEDVHRIQATWFIPDPQLREELRISVLEKLIPAYRSFLGRFRSHIESGRHPENYIKFSVEDLENAVLDFFEGYPVSQHLRRRSTT